MSIWVILKANIKHRKSTFISIAVLMSIIVATLVAVTSLNQNQNRYLDTSLDRANVGDIVLYFLGNDKKISTEDLLGELENNQDTESVEKIDVLYFDEDFYINGKENTSFTFLLKYSLSNHEYALYNSSLSGYRDTNTELQSGEIYLPLGMKLLYSCNVFDEVSITTSQGVETFIIKGFVEEPFIGAYFIGVKQVFISDQDYEHLAAENQDNQVPLIHIYQKEESGLTLSDYKDSLAKSSTAYDYADFVFTRSDSINYTMIFSNLVNGILYVFMVMLLAIVMIVMGHSITTGIEADYINLGILKAQGFTKEKMRFIFVLQYLLAEIIGAIIGTIVAIPIMNLLGSAFQQITGILAVAEISYSLTFVIFIGIIMLSCLFIFIKTIKINKISPLRAISGGRENVYFETYGTLPINKQRLHSSVALRQFTSNKKQYMGIIVIVGVLVYFMMSVIMLAGSMTKGILDGAFGIPDADIEITLNDLNYQEYQENFLADINVVSPIEDIYYSSYNYFVIDSNKYLGKICTEIESVVSKNLLKGRVPMYDNEVIMTPFMAKELEKEVGDLIIVSYLGKEKEFLIVGLYESIMDAGKNFTFTYDAAKDLYDFPYSNGYITLKDQNQVNKVISMLEDSYGDKLSALSINDVIENSTLGTVELTVNTISILIYSISIIFMLVVVSMVCGRVFIKERQDIGIFKAIGFTTNSLRLQFAFRFLLIAMIGSVLGLGLSILLSNKMFIALLQIMGISSFNVTYTLVIIVIPSAVACLCFFLFAYVASRKIKTVEIKELVIE